MSIGYNLTKYNRPVRRQMKRNRKLSKNQITFFIILDKELYNINHENAFR